MRIYDIIQKKRDGNELSENEIRYFIEGYVDGTIPDYQISALCMAIYFSGMSGYEIAVLTDAIAKSGDMIDLSKFGTLSVDKHSTGGVGDKTTIIVAPIVASLGGKVAKMSGRGLGHTGGTIDKLESIDGFKTTLSPSEFLKQVEDIGIAVIGQSGNLAPADKKLYALRDVTATVESPALIASSIMGKKIAAGSHSIVLDVKVGSGAFNKTAEDGYKLAEIMVEIGKKCGRQVTALLTDMDIPLGNAVGNSLEVIEAINVLKGNGPDDLKDVSVALASSMVSLALGKDYESAKKDVTDSLESGKAFNKFKEWISRQGGNSLLADNTELFSKAKFSYPVISKVSGYISKTDTAVIGKSSVILGGGREKKEDTIDYSAGIIINKKNGDSVQEGDLLATLFTNDNQKLEAAACTYLSALTFGKDKPMPSPHILGKVN